jgi:hypothetical protein
MYENAMLRMRPSHPPFLSPLLKYQCELYELKIIYILLYDNYKLFKSFVYSKNSVHPILGCTKTKYITIKYTLKNL